MKVRARKRINLPGPFYLNLSWSQGRARPRVSLAMKIGGWTYNFTRKKNSIDLPGPFRMD